MNFEPRIYSVYLRLANTNECSCINGRYRWLHSNQALHNRAAFGASWSAQRFTSHAVASRVETTTFGGCVVPQSNWVTERRWQARRKSHRHTTTSSLLGSTIGCTPSFTPLMQWKKWRAMLVYIAPQLTRITSSSADCRYPEVAVVALKQFTSIPNLLLTASRRDLAAAAAGDALELPRLPPGRVADSRHHAAAVTNTWCTLPEWWRTSDRRVSSQQANSSSMSQGKELSTFVL